MEPRIQYAKTSDGVNIAYAVFGTGPAIMYTPSFTGGVHFYSQFSLSRRGTDDLVALGWRIVRYDGRGTGSSDRDAVDFSLEASVRDQEAVMERLGLDLFASASSTDSGSTAPSVAFAVRHPESVSRLILRNPIETEKELYSAIPWVRAERALLPIATERWDLFCKSLAHFRLRFSDAEVANELAAAYRSAISPAAYLAFSDAQDNIDWSMLEAISMPTLVIEDMTFPGRSVGEVGASPIVRKAAARIPNARFEVTHDYANSVDAFLREDQPAAAAEPDIPSGMTAILFADIADSTGMTERMGDAAFREKARELDASLRAAIRERSGTPIEGKLLGDGVLAVFTSAREAIEAALACGAAGASAGLPLHLGIHAGDVIRERDPDGRDNIYGGAVNIASRIAGLSAAGEVLVSETVRSLARTSAGVRFEDRGEQALKGVGEKVRVWAVRGGEA